MFCHSALARRAFLAAAGGGVGGRQRRGTERTPHGLEEPHAQWIWPRANPQTSPLQVFAEIGCIAPGDSFAIPEPARSLFF